MKRIEGRLSRQLGHFAQKGGGIGFEASRAGKNFPGNGMGAPPYVSPAIFKEFHFQFLKIQADVAQTRVFKDHAHPDGDLSLVLDVLAHIVDALPRGSAMLDLRDPGMRKSRQELGDRICIDGNGLGALLVYETTEETDPPCRRPIEACAQGPDFVLWRGREVPSDAWPDNVRAMIRVLTPWNGLSKASTVLGERPERRRAINQNRSDQLFCVLNRRKGR